MTESAIPSLLLDGSLSIPLLGLVLLPAQQFAVNVGDLLQALFDLMIVLDPTADLTDLLGRHRAASPMRLVQGHAQIPYRSTAFTAGALAGRVATGHIAFHQGTP